MITRIRRLPSPALIVASVALVFAIAGGIGYAASKISGSRLKDHSVAGKKLKGHTIGAGKLKDHTLTGRQMKSKSIPGGKLKPDTVTGLQVNESTLGKVPSAAQADNATNANTANNANALGGVGPGGYQHALDWAVVSANATGAAVARGNATSAGRISAGNYFVSFSHSILGCAYVATNGDIADGVGPPGEISVEQRSATASPNDVEVRHYNSAGAQVDYGTGDGFHIIVICP
jgi:hypothetical protein